jgi:hypothetical protein
MYLYSTLSRVALGPSCLSNGFRRLSPGVNRPEREDGHSPPSSAEVKNDGATLLLFHMSSWHSVLLIKHRDSFNFTYTSYKKLTPRLPSQFCLRMTLALRVAFSVLVRCQRLKNGKNQVKRFSHLMRGRKAAANSIPPTQRLRQLHRCIERRCKRQP